MQKGRPAKTPDRPTEDRPAPTDNLTVALQPIEHVHRCAPTAIGSARRSAAHFDPELVDHAIGKKCFVSSPLHVEHVGVGSEPTNWRGASISPPWFLPPRIRPADDLRWGPTPSCSSKTLSSRCPADEGGRSTHAVTRAARLERGYPVIGGDRLRGWRPVRPLCTQDRDARV